MKLFSRKSKRNSITQINPEATEKLSAGIAGGKCGKGCCEGGKCPERAAEFAAGYSEGIRDAVIQMKRSFTNTILVVKASEKDSFDTNLVDFKTDVGMTIVTPAEARKLNMTKILKGDS